MIERDMGSNVPEVSSFYDEKGNFDVIIQIALNEKTFIPADKPHTALSEGDTLTFMLLLAGG